MGNCIHRWIVAAGISTVMFLAGSTALHAQGMRPMPPRNGVGMTPFNMGFRSPGMGFGGNMLVSPFPGFGNMMNGRTYFPGANSYGVMGYSGGGYGGSGNGGYGGGGSGGNGSSGYDSGSYNSVPS